NSWRQERGYVGKPGRPQMSAWQTVLVPLAVRQAGKDPAEFQAEVKKLYDAFDAQPFGDAKKVSQAAKNLAQWSDKLIAPAEKAKVDRPAALRLLREVCELGTKQLLDYDSARQVAWGFESIYHEVKPLGAADAQITAKLAAMEKDFKLTLPASIKVELTKE